MAQEQSDWLRSPERAEELIEETRATVYDANGELIDAADLPDALQERGVVIGENEDGTTAYSNVPEDLSLSAAHLAVDTRRDPEEFINPRPPSESEAVRENGNA